MPQMTLDELKKYNFEAKLGERKATFNLAWQDKEFRALVLGKLDDEDVGGTITVTVPILTNTKPLKNGDLVFLEKEPVVKRKDPAVDTWRTELKKKISGATSSEPPAKKQAT